MTCFYVGLWNIGKICHELRLCFDYQFCLKKNCDFSEVVGSIQGGKHIYALGYNQNE